VERRVEERRGEERRGRGGEGFGGVDHVRCIRIAVEFWRYRAGKQQDLF
jgi:hypothetical protein